MKIHSLSLTLLACMVLGISGCASGPPAASLTEPSAKGKSKKIKLAQGPSVAGWSKESICGSTVNWQEIESFRGADPISRSVIRIAQRHTVRLRLKTREQMIAKIVDMFPGSRPEDVELGKYDNNGGRGVCTGTLLNQSTIISAAHCFESNAITPSVWKDGEQIALNASMLALLFDAETNYQFAPATRKVRERYSRKITKLLEYKSDNLDYAIVKVQPFYGLERTMPLNAQTLPDNAPIAIVHHPLGYPKKVSIGQLSAQSDLQINYMNADTEEGSSGAGVLDERGRLVGIHTDGQCESAAFGFSNFGVPIKAISRASKILNPRDITQ